MEEAWAPITAQDLLEDLATAGAPEAEGAAASLGLPRATGSTKAQSK